jgi:hypothetical protein
VRSDDEITDGRLAFAFTMIGLLAAVGCFLALWRLPVYTTTSDLHRTTSQTLAEVNGDWVLVLAALPCVVAVVTWLGLYATCSRGSRAGQIVAGISVGLLGTVAFLGTFTIGWFLLPTAAFLCGAVVMTPRASCAPAHG